MENTDFGPCANAPQWASEPSKMEDMQTLMNAVIDSLQGNGNDIKLLLETGLDLDSLIQQVFTRDRLEQLYNVEPKRFHLQKKSINLKDVDSIIDKYMGGSYRSNYSKDSKVLQPSNELFIWCVLTKRQTMAKLIWRRGDGALVRALVASMMYRSMAKEAANDDILEMEIKKLLSYAEEFDQEALDLLDHSYSQNNGSAQELLTCKLPKWPGLTCLVLAYACHNRKLIAHPCFQMIVNDLWTGGLLTRRYTNLKILICLLCPPLCLLLRYKSADTIKLHRLRQSKLKLISDRDIDRRPISTISNDDGLQPKWPIKFLEFYTAPITKFWIWSIGYAIFLLIYTYTVLIRTPSLPEWNEYYVFAYLITFGAEKIREIAISQPYKSKDKLAVWVSNRWNCFDVFFVLLFFIGMALRLIPTTTEYGRMLYSFNIVYWYVRILVILRVFQTLGPFLTMISRMLRVMTYYIALILVVLISYGVFRQSVLYPNEEFSGRLVASVIVKPSLMIFGELFVEDLVSGLQEVENDPPSTAVLIARWLNFFMTIGFLFVVNILLVNLLIAVFNSIYQQLSENYNDLWKFHKFAVVIEYEQKPFLPPPFVFIWHLLFLLQWFIIEKCFRSKDGSVPIDLIGPTGFSVGMRLAENNWEHVAKIEKDTMKDFVIQQNVEKNETIDERIWLIEEQLRKLSNTNDLSVNSNLMEDSVSINPLTDLVNKIKHRTLIGIESANKPALQTISTTDVTIPPIGSSASSRSTSNSSRSFPMNASNRPSTPVSPKKGFRIHPVRIDLDNIELVDQSNEDSNLLDEQRNIQEDDSADESITHTMKRDLEVRNLTK